MKKKLSIFICLLFVIFWGYIAYYSTYNHEEIKKPKITVIVVMYNVKPYAKQCLQSVLDQDIDKEIIVVDDHSTDGTWKLLEIFRKEHPEVKILRNKENFGVVLNRYEGLKRANGEYLLFVDGDDELISQSLPKLYKEAISQKADILEFSCYTDGPTALKKVLLRSKEKIIGNVLEAYGNKKITNILPNKLISKRVYKRALTKINPDVKQANFSDVVYYLYHFLINAKNIVKTDTVGYFYYKFRGMTTRSSRIVKFQNYCDFITTKNELNRVYGYLESLEKTFEIVKKQAIMSYLNLSKEEQKEYLPYLYKLMNAEEVNARLAQR